MYQVDGYLFTSRERAKDAKREAEAVAYIREQTNLRDPDIVLKLYNRLLDEEVFDTPVGIAFLRDLQEHLRLIPYIKSEDIRPIPGDSLVVEKTVVQEKAKATAQRKKQEAVYAAENSGAYRRKYHVALFFAIVFAAGILGIYALTAFTGNSVTIANYEEEIINKYSAWEQDLNQREQELNQRESELWQREQIEK